MSVKSSSRVMKLFLSALLVVVGLVAGSREAAAYPQFQFSSGTNRCGQCHYSPSGGGLLTSWGRDESADTISAFGGDGAFLNGLVPLPSWLGLGGDFRLAALSNDVGNASGPENVVFPMQLDIYGRAAINEDWSINATVGVRGVTRPNDGSFGGRIGAVGDDFISREHYVMWRPSATGPYARAGRFFAPYGIRFVEHPYFIRRYTGFNLYQETYNLSGGYVSDEWEVHGTAFGPVPANMVNQLAAIGPQQSGVVGYGELRLAKMSALAGQFRLAFGDNQSRYQVGGIGKLWLEKPKILLLGEADLIHQTLTAASYSQNQFVSYTGLWLFPYKGLMASVAYERFQENLAVSTTGRNAWDLQVNFFPWAHTEAVFLGRYQYTGQGAIDGGTGTMFMFQLHYYL